MGEVHREKTHESGGDSLYPDPCIMILEVGGMIYNHWTDGNWCLPLVQAVLLCLFDTQEYCQSQGLGCCHCYSSSCNRILVSTGLEILVV